MIFIALAWAGCGGSDSPTSIGASLAPKVEQSTGWTFQSEPVFEVIDRPALLKKFEAKLQGEAGRRTAAAGRAFQTLGLLPKNYDLVAALKKAYVEELLAFYDPADRKIYLVKEVLDALGSGPSFVPGEANRRGIEVLGSLPRQKQVEAFAAALAVFAKHRVE